MRLATPCPNCGSGEIYRHIVGAHQDQVDLLPAVGHWLRKGEFDVYICGSCGHVRFFVAEDMVHFVRENWERVPTRLKRGPKDIDETEEA